MVLVFYSTTVKPASLYPKNAASELSLDSREVHLWSVSATAVDDQVLQLKRYLSEDELARAGRFHFEKDRRRFIIARGMLRTILSLYQPRPPEAHAFSCDRYGKPHLLDNQGLCFNLSHSGTQILYGLALERRIGVDIEYIRPVDSAAEIVENYFTEDEKRIFRQVPEHQKNEAFFNYWTRKEAYIKARGQGLQIPLNRFSVTFFPGEPARIIKMDWDCQDKLPWTLQTIAIEDGYAAAVAVEGENFVFKHRHWPWCAEYSDFF